MAGDDQPRIAVYGAGALGAYFGGKLASAGADVQLIARGNQLAALQAGPLRVKSLNGDFETPIRTTDEPAEIGPCDAVIVCVKAYHMEQVAAALGPLIGEDTAVVPVQNGILHIETLQQAIGPGRVLGGAAFLFASVPEPGLVVHSAGPGAITFGELDGRISERATRLASALSDSGIATELVDDIESRMWAKFVYICAHAGMTAAAHAPIGPIRDTAPAWAMFRRLLEEIVELAQAEGVALDPGTADGLIEFAASLEPDSLSSLYVDLEAGRQTELESLHGFAVERGERHGLELPMNRAVYSVLAARIAAGG